jgi:membrane protein DedA with SNARE-associated domain
MSHMSPLARILMRVLRSGSWGAALLLVAFAGIVLWQRWTPEGGLDLSRQDYAFLGVLAALLALAVYLVRAIRKELDRPGG